MAREMYFMLKPRDNWLISAFKTLQKKYSIFENGYVDWDLGYIIAKPTVNYNHTIADSVYKAIHLQWYVRYYDTLLH